VCSGRHRRTPHSKRMQGDTEPSQMVSANETGAVCVMPSSESALNGRRRHITHHFLAANRSVAMAQGQTGADDILVPVSSSAVPVQRNSRAEAAGGSPTVISIHVLRGRAVPQDVADQVPLLR
jgi:hypothetical protein